MTTIITCRECNRDYNVEKLKPGARLRCRGCSCYLTVPGGTSMACVSCGQMFAVKNAREGMRFRCQKCSTMMQIDSQLIPRKIADDAADKRVEIVSEATAQGNGDAAGEQVDEVQGHGAAMQAQKSAPPPTGRRFGDGQEYLPDLDDLFAQRKLLAAFLFSKGGILLSGHTEQKFDAELLTNSVYYFSGIASYLGDTFSIGGNGTSSIRLENGNARFSTIGGNMLLVVSKGEYDGGDDTFILAKLNQKKDLL